MRTTRWGAGQPAPNSCVSTVSLASSNRRLYSSCASLYRALAESWLEDFRGGGLDGVVAKRRDQRYEPGTRAMLKVKHERTADCVLAGMRVAGDPAEVTSLMLGLYDNSGTLEHIGVVGSLAKRVRTALGAELGPSSPRLPAIHGSAASSRREGRPAG